jgi:cytochrome c-type biogenesis protein CcmH/NrfG
MPGDPDPRINLAKVFAKAGRVDDALGAYASAHKVYPNHLHATERMIRLQSRSGRTNDHILAMLDEVALRGEDQHWMDWARVQKVRLSSRP